MNKELIASMRTQMVPSEAARAALAEKLAAPSRKRRYAPYAAGLAACALLALTPWLVQQYDELKQMLYLQGIHYDAVIVGPTHEVIYCEGGVSPGQAENTAVDRGEGDRDMVMETGELVERLTDEGFTREQIDTYLAEGWVMTWSSWWKYFQNRAVDADWNALLKVSRAPVNTGDLPSAPADQGEAAAAYQNLMAWFQEEWGPVTGSYPDWYGGAYIDGQGCLIVLIVEELSPWQDGSKELYMQVQERAGTDRIGFGEAKFSLGTLRGLQMKVTDAMAEMGLLAGCWVNEGTNRVELDLVGTTQEALELLYRLDPDNEMILVRAALPAATEENRHRLPLVSEPVSGVPEEEDPAGFTVQPGGNTPVEDDGDLIAVEPWYDGGTEAYEPGEERSASESYTPSSAGDTAYYFTANTASYAPGDPRTPVSSHE